MPYGTRVDTYRTGYEWIAQSRSAIDVEEVDKDRRVGVGGPDCLRPYRASLFHICALSFGVLSPNAIHALKRGASLSDFAHNTGGAESVPVIWSMVAI